jgi:hypothetical protein
MMARTGLMRALYPGNMMPTPRRKKVAKKYRFVQ